MNGVFKINSGKYDPKADDVIKMREDHIGMQQGRCHSKQICIHRPHTDLRKYGFIARVHRLWNTVPESVIKAPSLNVFKSL